MPQAQGLLVEAVKKMTVADAKGILKGGDDAATEYLDKSSREQLRAKFLPIVKQATDEVSLVAVQRLASQAATLVDAKSANVEGYVTEQALDGLFRDDRQAGEEHPPEPGGGRARPGRSRRGQVSRRTGAIAPSPPVRPAPRPSRGTRRHRAPAGTAG